MDLIMQRKPAKGKGKVSNKSKEQPDGVDAAEASQTQAQPQTVPVGSDASEATQTQAQDAVVASQVSIVVEPSQDLFDDIPDEVIATLPEVQVSDLQKYNEPTNDKGKKEKVKTENVKKEKVKKVIDLYHGKPRRSSERVKQNAFKTPITGVGASQEAPIEINEAETEDLTHDDSKLGTCFRVMKSWKDFPKKK
jgi:hypothetical protein